MLPLSLPPPPLAGALLTLLTGASTPGETPPTPRDPSQLEQNAPPALSPPPDLTEVAATALTVLDLVGVFAFAVSGALLAARKRYDLVGSLVLGTLVGLGGGFTRDVVLNRDPPAAFENPLYLAMPVAAALLVYLHVINDDRGQRTLKVFDAVGLAVFCVVGTRVALIAGYDPIPAALLGTVTAVGGGLLRDVVAGEPPAIFGREGWYAVPAFLGALTTALLGTSGWLTVLSSVLVMAGVFVIRLLALRRDWRVTSSVLRRRDGAPPIPEVHGSHAAPDEPELGPEDDPEADPEGAA